MRYGKFKYLVGSDLYRHAGKKNVSGFFYYFYTSPGFKYSFFMRLCAFLRAHRILRYGFYHAAKFILGRYIYKFGIMIPFQTRIGSGFNICHFSGIFVNEQSVIGKNCNISQGVTIGQANRGKRKGCPVIGDNVYIGPGAKIIGNVRIGNNVAIGANCVVTGDVPDNAVVVGVPGRIISYLGSEDYITYTDY